MSFLGMGPMEIILIFLVAFLLLGHERMIDTARLLGKAAKEIRRMTSNISQIIPEDEIGQASATSQNTRETSVQPQGNRSTSQLNHTSGSTDSSLVSPEESVGFRSSTDVSAQEPPVQETTSD